MIVTEPPPRPTAPSAPEALPAPVDPRDPPSAVRTIPFGSDRALVTFVAWFGLAAAGLAAGALLRWVVARPDHAATAWAATLLIAGAPFVWKTVRELTRGHFAADVVAAVALVVAFAQGQHAAGLVIVLMLATGQALEAYSHRRATDALAALLKRAPRLAHRLAMPEPAASHDVAGPDIEDVAVEVVLPGDRLLVRPGELVPVDSVVVEGESSVDESALTGEPLPIAKAPGSELRSGTVNVDGALEVRALRAAADSEYAQVVRLMEAAQHDRPAIQRTADRVAVWFTPLTLAIAGVAYFISGEASRVLAVLVVATPCPLILATPVALIGGINRAARHGVVVKNGAAIELLSQITAAVFDKTGTLTFGRPVVCLVAAIAPGVDDTTVIRLAAAVEQRSPHLLARAVVAEADRRGVDVPDARAFREVVGRGAHALVDGREVVVGSYGYVSSLVPAGGSQRCAALVEEATSHAQLVSGVAIDGVCAGVICYADEVRPGLPAFMDRLRGLGVGRLAMLTGDGWATARSVAAQAGIDDVRADLRPADKTAAIAGLRAHERGVLMVGDGINDAPALATATVGVAMGARGAAISAAAADVVLLVDDIRGVANAVAIGKRTMRIVWECIAIGLVLSGLAMAAAAFGLIHPVAGAAIQEVIDLMVVLNALRAR